MRTDSRITLPETYKRLHSSQGVSPVILHLNDCAHRFVKGSQISLIIAGGSHPQFAINTGNGVEVHSDGLKSTVHAIYFIENSELRECRVIIWRLLGNYW